MDARGGGGGMLPAGAGGIAVAPDGSGGGAGITPDGGAGTLPPAAVEEVLMDCVEPAVGVEVVWAGACCGLMFIIESKNDESLPKLNPPSEFKKSIPRVMLFDRKGSAGASSN